MTHHMPITWFRKQNMANSLNTACPLPCSSGATILLNQMPSSSCLSLQFTTHVSIPKQHRFLSLSREVTQ